MNSLSPKLGGYEKQAPSVRHRHPRIVSHIQFRWLLTMFLSQYFTSLTLGTAQCCNDLSPIFEWHMGLIPLVPRHFPSQHVQRSSKIQVGPYFFPNFQTPCETPGPTPTIQLSLIGIDPFKEGANFFCLADWHILISSKQKCSSGSTGVQHLPTKVTPFDRLTPGGLST